jgi:HEPN domain-containing protein
VAIVDEPEFLRWRRHAESTRVAAHAVADAGRPEWACFLAEQAAQLAVKGLLHGAGEEAWGHDLTVLVARATASLAPAWPSGLEDQAARLSRHYIAARYPDAHPGGPPSQHYRPSDADQALADAAELQRAVDGAWHALGGGP